MATPTTREEMKTYCLRKLGHPVIRINIDEEQMEDRIDEALQFFYENHYDGVEKIYRKHLVTSTDITNGYLSLPDEFIGVVRIFRLEVNTATGNPFNFKYQFALSEMPFLTGGNLNYYTTARQYINLIQDTFSGDKSFRFVRHKNILRIDMDWTTEVAAGDYIVVECYKKVAAEDNSDVYNDMFLKRYITALFKYQWGSNLTKFKSTLPGNMEFNGDKIYEEAKAEIKELELDIHSKYSTPPMFFVG